MEVQLCNKTIITFFFFFCNIEQLLNEDFVISGINLALKGRDPFVQRRRSLTWYVTSYNACCPIRWTKVAEALGT